MCPESITMYKKQFSDYAMFIIFLCSLGLVFNTFFSENLNKASLIIIEFLCNITLSYAIYSISKYKNITMILFILAFSVLATHFFNCFIIQNDPYIFFIYLLANLFYLSTVIYLTIAYVFTFKKLSNDKFFGMISAYVLLAFLWAILFTFLVIFTATPFDFRQNIVFESGQIITFSFYLPELLYYSFIILTCVATGDIWPLTQIAQNLTAIEGMTGTFYIAIVIARIVNSDIKAVLDKGRFG